MTDERKNGAEALLRVLTAVAAAALVLLVVVYPRAFGAEASEVNHGGFVLMMLGMSVAWVSGFGFTPRNRWLAKLFTPVPAWVLMGLGLWLSLGGNS